MKKITTFIITVLILLQGVSFAHALVDSITCEGSVISNNDENIVAVNSIDNTNDYVSEDKSCLESCHGHAHFYINNHFIKQPHLQKLSMINMLDELFTGIVNKPNSPPPNFS